MRLAKQRALTTKGDIGFTCDCELYFVRVVCVWLCVHILFVCVVCMQCVCLCACIGGWMNKCMILHTICEYDCVHMHCLSCNFTFLIIATIMNVQLHSIDLFFPVAPRMS